MRVLMYLYAVIEPSEMAPPKTINAKNKFYGCMFYAYV